jgi:phenylalanyl-tRNA synthetase beta chain
VRIVHAWLRDLVDVPSDVEAAAREIALRGFEVAAIDDGPLAAIDFEITANRPDCLSHLGIAREAATIWRTPVRLPGSDEGRTGVRRGSDEGQTRVRGGSDEGQTGVGPRQPQLLADVRIDDADWCPRYCAQVFEVTIASSPSWLASRLQAAGVRPINNIVDVTNYVMLEMGQPMHAFDLEKLHDRSLVIRRARPGERLRTLDGVDRALDPDMLVIADAHRPVALGGVMGGQESEISAGTRVIALESAYFQPASIRRTSKRLALKTEASIRFERGADIEAPPSGIARAAALMQQIGGGHPCGALLDRYPKPRTPARIVLRGSRITRVLGLEIPDAEIPRILQPLGFSLIAGGADRTWTVTVPTFRVDVAREIDLIEEVGRHFGFDRLPPTFPPLSSPQPAPDVRVLRDRRVRQLLTAAGCSEATTFAFIERAAALPFCDEGWEPHAIANPLSEKFAVLRPSLLPGLVDACAHNRRRERRDVRLFEAGSRFTRRGEERAVAFAWCGAASEPHWSAPPRMVDFFDVKGIVETLCDAFGAASEFAPCGRSYLVPGRAAEVRVTRDGVACSLGILGQLNPDVLAARGFPGGEDLYAAELDLAVLEDPGAMTELRARQLPRFPSIVRDLSILVDEVLPAASVRGTIRSAAPDTLVSISEFDRYQGKGVPEGRVSLSLRLTFRATDRTLTDEEVQAATDLILDRLRSAHGAERR